MTAPGVPNGTAGTIGDELARFVVDRPAASLPEEVKRFTVRLVLDAVATAVANRDAPFAAAMRRVVAASDAAGPCTVIGAGGAGLGPEGAAEANSAAVHGSDLDATHIASIIHPTAIAVPVGLAVGESVDASGGETVAAIALGMETLIRLGLAAGGAYHVRGFQPTALLGPVAAALLTARLHGRSAIKAAEGAGLATAVGAGLRSFSDDGTWGKRLITGWACRAGIHADALVGAGYRGTRDGIEKRWGIFTAFIGEGTADLAAITDALGDRWHVLETAPKRFPCSHGLHPFIESALALRPSLADRAVVRAECTVNTEAARWWFEPHAARYRPDAYGARFSIPYGVARALLDGEVTDASFSASAVADEAALALAARVVPVVDPTLEARAPVGLPGELRLSLDDGTTLALPEAPGHGDPGPWMEERALAALTDALGPEAARRLQRAILGLDARPSVRGVLAEAG